MKKNTKESKETKKILDKMEWKRLYREIYKERFIPTNANWSPDDEDLSDKYEYRRFKKDKTLI